MIIKFKPIGSFLVYKNILHIFSECTLDGILISSIYFDARNSKPLINAKLELPVEIQKEKEKLFKQFHVYAENGIVDVNAIHSQLKKIYHVKYAVEKLLIYIISYIDNGYSVRIDASKNTLEFLGESNE